MALMAVMALMAPMVPTVLMVNQHSIFGLMKEILEQNKTF
jgi:hypothetical protein